ncbi:hypothetical protein GW17_00003553 [Ensete ventricosum]|nr:hypothetical protein GW17_00003553 [Ensete ventricosum]
MRRLWPAMVVATGKGLGSTGSDTWQWQWWRCRGRKAWLRARDATVASKRRRRQRRKGRKRDGRGGLGYDRSDWEEKKGVMGSDEGYDSERAAGFGEEEAGQRWREKKRQR